MRAKGWWVCLPLLAAGWAAEPARFRVGVCTHFSQDKGHLPANLSLIRQAGVISIRDEVGWRGVERAKGELVVPPAWDTYVRRAAEEDLEPLLILDYGNPFYDGGDKPISEAALEGFARYSEFIVRHFKGVVKLYEVWNEWDIGIGGTTPGTPESYVKLLEKVYPRIKAVDRSVTVYGGAMTPSGVQRGWLEGMLKAGGLKHLDEVSIHTYNYSSSGRERSPEAWAEWMQQVDGMLRKYNGGQPVGLTVTEMGWPTQIDRRGTPPEVAAAYLARMLLLARTLPFMKGIWWYDFQDDGWRSSYNEHNFGLVRPDLTPKPAYFSLKDLARLVATAEYLGRVEAGDPEVWILSFRRPDGKHVWALWSAHEDDGWQVVLRTDRPKPVLIQQVAHGAIERQWGTRDWAGMRGAPVNPNQLELLVRETPWLITGDLGTVTVAELRRREFPEATRAIQFLR